MRKLFLALLFLAATHASGFVTYMQGSVTGTVTNTTTETNLLTGGTGTLSLDPSWMLPNKTVRILIDGDYSISGVLPTLTFKVKIGSTTTSVAASGIVVNASHLGLHCTFLLTGMTTGASGTLRLSGRTDFTSTATVLGTVLFPTRVEIPATTLTLDTTVPESVQITATWGTASSSNTLLIYDGLIYAD